MLETIERKIRSNNTALFKMKGRISSYVNGKYFYFKYRDCCGDIIILKFKYDSGYYLHHENSNKLKADKC